jgi:hypothetical protein
VPNHHGKDGNSTKAVDPVFFIHFILPVTTRKSDALKLLMKSGIKLNAICLIVIDCGVILQYTPTIPEIRGGGDMRLFLNNRLPRFFVATVFLCPPKCVS